MRTSHERTKPQDRREALTLRSWGDAPVGPAAKELDADTSIDCGWGRLIFAHTFKDPKSIVGLLTEERTGTRDIAIYIRDPHVILSIAPQQLFLDPSHTYRLWLSDYRPPATRPRGFMVRRLETKRDAREMNRIYDARGMVTTRSPTFAHEQRAKKLLTYFVAQERKSDSIIGTVTGVDHVAAFNDPDNGSSLWCLAVDPQASHPGIGAALVAQLAEHYLARGREFMDLSVMHDNTEAIALYEKMGFIRVPAFCVKRKNPINERLFIGPDPSESLNPYATIIVNEARRRGIEVDVIDAPHAYFSLSYGGRSVTCRESLSELTSGVAFSICDDKTVSRLFFEHAGLSMPQQREAGTQKENNEFLKRYGPLVVKPAHGEQGRGISVDVRTQKALKEAVVRARQEDDQVLLEEYVEGEDLRIIVIGGEVVAGAVRRPPEVTGTGRHTVKELIQKQSRRRSSATGGESKIPIDDETTRVVELEGCSLDDVLPAGETVKVRRTANLHTGGTIHDVTSEIHQTVREAATRAAAAIDIPVVGLDFIVPSADSDEYVIIEANERPGLANHEPQPTAERFIDLLFPQTAAIA